MNFTACIKSARIKPNYVLNVSIDIPLKSAKILSDRSHIGDFTFSPSRLKLNKKIKLTAQPSNAAKTTRDADSRKISSCMGETQHTISGLNKKKTLQSTISQNRRERDKNRSCEVSPKRKLYLKDKDRKKKSVVSNRSMRNSKVLNRLVNDSDDNFIRYTNDSAELKREVESRGEDRRESKKTEEHAEDIDVHEIREYEKLAIERKEHLNYLYLKQKVLVLASVKKIQRAWRNYRTKKLLKSYSNNISLKLTSKLKNKLNNDNILTVRSLGADFKKKKKEIVGISETELKQICSKYDESREKEGAQKEKNKNRKISEKLKEFQMEELRKWEELRNQIRMGRNVEDILEDSFKRKRELEEELQKSKRTDSLSSHSSDLPKKNTDKKEPSEPEGTSTEKRRKKLEFFESEIRKIDNENSDANSISEFDYVEPNKQNARISEQIENQKLKKKLQIFNRLELLDDHTEMLYENGSDLDIDLSESEYEDKLETHRQNNSREKNLPLVEESKLRKSKSFKEVLTQSNCEMLIGSFIHELVYEMFLEVADSDAIVQKMKVLYEKAPKVDPVLQVPEGGSQRKPEGICTNLESVKDYLENLVAYLFEEHPKLFEEKLLQPCGPTPTLLFSYLRGELMAESTHTFIMSELLFEEHWSYASEQIYFDTKYEDPQRELERTTYLKNLTRIYFRAIFDAFNECLQPFRLHGLLGKPYPWKLQRLVVSMPDPKRAVRGAYKKLSGLATVFCGLHLEDKKHSMSEQVIKQIQNERMNTFLEMQFSDDEYRWSMHDDEEAEVLLKIAQFIQDWILGELGAELRTIF